MNNLQEKKIFNENKKISLSNDNLIDFKKKENIILSSPNVIERYSESEKNLISNNKNNNDNVSKFINNENKINIKDSLSTSENSKKNILKIEDKFNNNEININNDYPYLLIDSKNYFTEESIDHIKEINDKLKLKYKNKESKELINNISEKISKNLFEYLFEKIYIDDFDICKEISKIIEKKKLLENNLLENNLNFFFVNRINYQYNSTIKIDKQFINNCGPILCKIYKNLDKYKIKDSKSLINAINEVRNKKIDLKNEYYIYYYKKELKPEAKINLNFFKSIKKKYILQPELIYLLNLFQSIKKIEIEFDFKEELFDINEFYLFIIIILNINYLIYELKDIKLNLINRNLQFGIYGIYFLKLLKESRHNNYFKKNIPMFDNLKYHEKWNFEKDFLLEDYRLLHDGNLVKMFYSKKENKLLSMEYLNIYKEDINKEINFSKNSTNKNRDSNIINNYFSLKHTDTDDKENTERRSCPSPNSSNNKISEQKDSNFSYLNIKHFEYIVSKCSNILEMIFITFESLKYFKNLEEISLILNESYFNECISYFENICKIKSVNYHILDIIYNKLIEMKSLNFEINSFDLITFNKILKILYNNKRLSSLKFSLFSSDYTYFSEAIHKTNLQNISTKIMKIIPNIKKGLDFRIEDKFFKNIYPYFVLYINYFFEIIKNKELNTLGINLDIPGLIVNDEKYVIVLIKLIINILLLCIVNNKSKVKELIVLSSNLIINNNRIIFFDKFLKNIKNNNNLQNLSLQIKFYNMVNIHKLINEKLQILKIGDFDLFSLKYFVENITKYEFCKNSHLKVISISLNKMILYIDDEMQLVLAKLFYIKIQNLSSINLYTNIEVKNEKVSKQIISLLEDNWISSYKITFNLNSIYIRKNKLKLIKNIKYIISKKNNKIEEKNNETDISGKIFLCLNNLFNKNYDAKILDFYKKKKIISNILKFLYISKTPSISFSLEKKKKNN